jgi:small subunit ribosomal protein S6
MKPYELTILFHPDLEMNLDPALEKVKKLLIGNGANIIKEDNEGKKRLAYQINKQDFAIYYYFELELPAQAPAKISSVLNITDEVIRYLLVAKDAKKEKLAAKNKSNPQEETEEEEK